MRWDGSEVRNDERERGRERKRGREVAILFSLVEWQSAPES